MEKRKNIALLILKVLILTVVAIIFFYFMFAYMNSATNRSMPFSGLGEMTLSFFIYIPLFSIIYGVVFYFNLRKRFFAPMIIFISSFIFLTFIFEINSLNTNELLFIFITPLIFSIITLFSEYVTELIIKRLNN